MDEATEKAATAKLDEADQQIRDVLRRVGNPNARAIDLLGVYHTTAHLPLWQQDPRLYRGFAARLVAQGHPALGLRLARRGLRLFPGDPDLLFRAALAYARGGNLPDARAAHQLALDWADRPPADGEDAAARRLRADIRAQHGRLLKDEGRREPPGAGRVALFRQAAVAYERAVDGAPDPTYPRINAATLWRAAGNADRAADLARRVIAAIPPAAADGDDYWVPATLGEAHTLTGEYDKSVEFYRKAVRGAVARRAFGDIAAMRVNLGLLREAGATLDPAEVEAAVGAVVVFAGHMIDSPSRARKGLPSRFPDDPELVAAVAERIKRQLDEWKAAVGFSSLACGSDVLFAEAVQARSGGELHVVLPFAEADFLRESVDYGRPEMESWADRYHGVLARMAREQADAATREYLLHRATTEPYLGAHALYDFVNTYTQGMAALRAAQFLVRPKALVVLDRGSEGGPGGTQYFLDTWTKAGYEAEVIDLDAVRRELEIPARPLPRPAGPAPAPDPAGRRPIKAMLFADVAKFSKLPEHDTCRFFDCYTGVLAEVVAAAKDRIDHVNTWGDGLYVVFGRVADAADFALTLLREVRDKVPFKEFGFADANPVRVGLHAGPVFEIHDRVLGRTGYSGQHINRTARIEPVTLPGCAFASEQFAAVLTMEAPTEYRCDFVGFEDLAKDFDVCALYRVSRKAPPPAGT